MTATDWAALTKPFKADEIELLPKQVSRDDQDRGTCKQGSKYSADGNYCGKYHARSVHLSYVGHAGLTMRLNEVVTPAGWDWEPLALDPQGLPLISNGGMWIRLTIGGISKLGFGDAQGKTGPNAVKEMIGDALRNAGMRFGIATYLWSKSDKAAAQADPEPEPMPVSQDVSDGPYGHGDGITVAPPKTPKQQAWDYLTQHMFGTPAERTDVIVKALAPRDVGTATANDADWLWLLETWQRDGIDLGKATA